VASRKWVARVVSVLCVLTLTAIAQPAHAASPAATSGPITIQSGCTWPPCGEIYNHTDAWWNISRQDCDGCGWIYDSIGPGQHKGGYWNDGIDWDRFAVPYRCSVTGSKNGTPYTWSNYTTNPQRWISFASNETVDLNSYTCQGV
jgi:hypothetical protein